MARLLYGLAVAGAVTGLVPLACSSAYAESAESADAAPPDGESLDAGPSDADPSPPRDSFLHVVGGFTLPEAGGIAFVPRAYRARLEANGSVGPWERAPGLDVERGGGGTAVDGRNVYLIAGHAASDPITNRVVRTTFAADSGASGWSQSAPLPSGRYLPAAIAHAGRVYATGGAIFGMPPSRDVFVFDETAGSWAAADRMLDGLSGHGIAVVGSRLFVVGGQMANPDAGNTSLTRHVSSADLLADGGVGPWRASSEINSTFYFGAMVAVDRFIFAIGGLGDNNTGSDIVARGEVAEDGTVKWTSIARLPAGPDYAGIGEACAVVVGRRIYVAGGRFALLKPPLTSVLVGEVSASGVITWTTTTPLPEGTQAASCFVQ